MGDDASFMRLAIAEAERATAEGNQPFGAVVVVDGRVIGRGHNRTQTDGDPTAHAEVMAVRDAARTAGSLRLPGATLYATCEPCLMCTGALVSARVSRVAIGALWADAPAYFNHPEHGSLTSVAPHVAYPFRYETGVLREECVRLYR